MLVYLILIRDARYHKPKIRLPTLNILWPVDVSVGGGSSEYGKLLVGFLHGKNFGKQLYIHQMEIATD